MAIREIRYPNRAKYIDLGNHRIPVSAPIEVPWLTGHIGNMIGRFTAAYPGINFPKIQSVGLVQFADFAALSEAETHEGGWCGSLLDEVANRYLSRAALQTKTPGRVDGWDFFLRGMHAEELEVGKALVKGFQSQTPQKLLDTLAKGYFDGKTDKLSGIQGFDHLRTLSYANSIHGPELLQRLSTAGSFDYRDNTICLFISPHILTLFLPQIIELGVHDIHELVSAYGPFIALMGSVASEGLFLKNVMSETIAHEVCHALAFRKTQSGQITQSGLHKKIGLQ